MNSVHGIKVKLANNKNEANQNMIEYEIKKRQKVPFQQRFPILLSQWDLQVGFGDPFGITAHLQTGKISSLKENGSFGG